jgi:hypothetical protein
VVGPVREGPWPQVVDVRESAARTPTVTAGVGSKAKVTAETHAAWRSPVSEAAAVPGAAGDAAVSAEALAQGEQPQPRAGRRRTKNGHQAGHEPLLKKSY